MIERVSPPGAPAPRGPYSPGVKAGDWVYVAGQVAMDPVSGEPMLGDIQSETRQTLLNVQSILAACGASMSQVVRCGVYLTNVADFQAMNEVYAEFFGDAKPARTTIAVAALPLPAAKVEIDAIAYIGKD
jgi:2-iminobutanoate/2-iminopropanoate deaminase